MKIKIILYLVCILGCITIASAQDFCGAHEKLQERIQSIPGLQAYINRYLDALNRRIANYPFNPDLHQSAITVPVVIHVMYKNAAENLSDAVINEQIDILNASYRRRNNSEINGIPAAFKPKAEDAYIQFKLATRDPNGRATTGITRKSTTKAFFDMVGDEAKTPPNGVAAWDPHRYLNIWLCDLRRAGSDGLNGYGHFPEDSIKSPSGIVLDGIVMDYCAFGMNSCNPQRNKARTLPHEIGHYFGLRHIWGDADCGDDLVDDTPTQKEPNRTLPTFPKVTCGNGPNGDMFMNFMDYTNDPARMMFTAGQRQRMLANIAPGGRRSRLAVSNGLFPANATSRDYEVFLEPQHGQLPSWKAALVMTHAWACQCTPALDIMLQQNAGKRGSRYSSMGTEIADAVYALALTPEEMLACYTIEGFYQKLNRGPVAVLSVGSNEFYGLVIHGMVIDQTQGRALLKIKDPMSIGPKGFFITNQTGAEYQVDYNEFMTQMLERAVINNKHIYIVYPPTRTIP